MPLSTALNEDNLPCQSNSVDAETIGYWNTLKSMHGIAPKISPENLVFIAVRDTEAQEDALIERLNITNHTVAEVNQQGVAKTAEAIIAQLNSCEQLYISFDVDSMDPELTSYGTGTPVPGGLTPAQVSSFFNLFIATQKVVCIEFVEINPCLDEKKNKMAETAFELLQPIINQLIGK
jgi:arginase